MKNDSIRNGTSSSKFAALLTNTPVSAELALLKQSSKRAFATYSLRIIDKSLPVRILSRGPAGKKPAKGSSRKSTMNSKLVSSLTNKPVSAELALLKQSSKRAVRDLLAKIHRQKFAGPNPFAGSGREKTCEMFVPQKHDEF